MAGYDVIVVGAGISGATLAERFAAELDMKVLVLEKRGHVGGNCHDAVDAPTGVRISSYGAHLFHTSYPDVWEYVQRFASWSPYAHKVLACVDGKLVPVPVNLTTVNALLHLGFTEAAQMRAWIAENAARYPNPQNGEEAALARVGPELYEKIFKHYTYKQWERWPKELDAEVLQRIPVREDTDDRYFSDPYQAQPVGGFTGIFERMLAHPNITVELNADWEAVKDRIGPYRFLFFTGPIDAFFNYRTGEKLEYRSIRFELERVDKEFFQENSVVNYPSPDTAFTRIIEYKHITGDKTSRTTIAREYSTWEGEPYYPVPSARNRAVYARYAAEAAALEKDGIYFVGRLANYKYFNMDQAFKNALNLFARIKATL